MKLVIRIFVIFCILASALPARTYAANNPLRANLFLSWNITESDAIDLARWDLIVLDAEVGARQPELIKKIRTKNPSIRILAYVSPVELHTFTEELEAEAPLRSALLAEAPEQYYVHRADGSAVSFWPTAHVMNITGPWRTLVEKFIQKKILTNKLWDGVMLDNVWDGLTWYVGGVDLNDDGLEDSAIDANAAWRSAMHSLIADVKKQNPHKLIVGNGSTDFTELDGVLFENFPDHGWTETVSRATEFQRNKKIIVFNTTSSEKSLSQMQFGLASAVLFDAYFAFDFGSTNHASKWWFDAYDHKLGKPLGPAAQVETNLWERTFAHGLALVNTGDASTTRDLAQPYDLGSEQLTHITLGPQTGVVLTEPIKQFSIPFNHPAMWAHFYSMQGTETHAPLAITASKSGTRTIPQSPKLFLNKKLTEGGARYTIKTTTDSQALRIKIFDSKKALVSEWQILKTNSNEPVYISVRDVNHDGIEEIIILRLRELGAQ